MTKAQSNISKPKLPVAIAVVVIIVTLICGWLLLRHSENNPQSEDAIISAAVVHISPAIPGQIVELNVQEGSHVKRGDLLFRLDREVYELQLRQAEAQLAIAQSALSARGRQVRAETANSSIANEQITRARTNLALTERTVQRLKPLAAKGYVPQQELDMALTAEHDARVSLTQAMSQARAAQELVGDLDATQAAVRGAEAAVALAHKALVDTEVRAPSDGITVGVNVSAGERLAPGQSLFTLINSEHWYAVAFFVETELSKIHNGACVSVYALADSSQEMHGKVVNIGWGVNNEDIISLPRALPYVQKSLNWVRVAQRFPVKILLDAPPPSLMRVGASASVVVRPGTSC
jgi:multidrug efflux system membrane fusion protein